MARIRTYARLLESLRRTCEACGARLPAQPHQGNPRRFGCEACRVWSYRHPEQMRQCRRCDAGAVTD
ncbi:hypothetical protein ACFFWC_24655 [Plantactinospora siamensis]|uniref:Uncharacterized protein n=1 Tax=Plantactinospora siamensis TaxID=555372 RepID=A0ABV6P6H1_9ACTN